MESEEFNQPTEVKPQKRPSFLSVICVLTFIGSGCSALSYLFMGLSFGTLRHLVFETDLYEAYFNMAPAMRSSMEAVFALPRWYFFVNGCLYLFSLFGAIRMWNLHRNGFHIYTLSQCLVILLGMLMVPGEGIPFNAIFWTGLFVALYAVSLKHMDK